MAIARKPGSKPTPLNEEKAERFISSAGQAPAAPASINEADSEARRKPVMIRFDRALLAKVDKAAKHRGVNRSAFISYVISRALESE